VCCGAAIIGFWIPINDEKELATFVAQKADERIAMYDQQYRDYTASAYDYAEKNDSEKVAQYQKLANDARDTRDRLIQRGVERRTQYGRAALLGLLMGTGFGICGWIAIYIIGFLWLFLMDRIREVSNAIRGET
jgi:hypothetical protein